jgi:hypothetical protein
MGWSTYGLLAPGLPPPEKGSLRYVGQPQEESDTQGVLSVCVVVTWEWNLGLYICRMGIRSPAARLWQVLPLCALHTAGAGGGRAYSYGDKGRRTQGLRSQRLPGVQSTAYLGEAEDGRVGSVFTPT